MRIRKFCTFVEGGQTQMGILIDLPLLEVGMCHMYFERRRSNEGIYVQRYSSIDCGPPDVRGGKRKEWARLQRMNT